MPQGHPDEVRLAAARPSGPATVISHLLDPVVLIPLGAWLVCVRSESQLLQALAWFAILLASICIVPSCAVLVLLRRGRLTDRDMTRREQRLLPLLLAGISTAAGTVVLAGSGAPRAVVVYAATVMAGIALTVLVTVGFKISIHSAVAASFAVQLGWLYGAPWALVGVSAVVAVAWARWRAGRHSPAQVILGVCLGGGLTTLVLRLFL